MKSNKELTKLAKPLVVKIDVCPVCVKDVYDNMLYTRDDFHRAYHLACFNETKKDDKGEN
jgi:hypothetical protein